MARKPKQEPTDEIFESSRKQRKDQYQARKDRERERQAEQSREGRDIGPVPPVVDKKAREKCIASFRHFCETIFPLKFYLGWSKDHLEVIKRIQASIDEGLIYALAMPRGSGKSTLVVAAALWAIVTGRRRYIALIGADRDAAQKLLAGLKVELETNDMLLALFPEAVFPIRALEGKANKSIGQTFNGKRTYIEWKGPRIVFAAIPGALCSQAIIEVQGILGRVRGMQFTRSDGVVARPDFFVLDDPQTDRSAVSLTQINRRLSIITGAVLGLAGPDQSICGFATITVMAEGDVADQLLDRDNFPDWQGTRYQLVYKWPDRFDLWEQYGSIRAESLKVDGNIAKATEFYRKHRDDMDRGAVVAWDQRYNTKNEISALQHAYNLKFKTPETFDAEYQNKPKGETCAVELLSIDAIEEKIHGYKRGELPPEANCVTSFIDVQGKLLYYVTCAWNRNNFTGYVIDYGAWPQQTAKHYVLRTVELTLSKAYPKMGIEARWRKSLFDLINYLDDKTYTSIGNSTLKHQAIGIDAAYGKSTKTIYAVCREHPQAARLYPFFGRGIGPDQVPMHAWPQKEGEHRGDNWVLRASVGGGRHVVSDSNSWKSFLHARWNVPLGDPSCMSLYTPQMRTEHRMIAEHQRAEQVKVQKGKSSEVEVWYEKSTKPDNHLFDALYQNCILASMCGAHLPEITTAKRYQPPKRKRRVTSLKI